MGKPEWGVKRQCASCGVRFYDLLRDPITCPECGAVFEVAALVRGKRTRPASGRAEAVKKPEVSEAEDLDVDLDDDDAGDDDGAVLDDDDDETADVVVPGVAAADDAGDDDDAIEGDDTVLLDDDDDDLEDEALGDFDSDVGEDEDDRR